MKVGFNIARAALAAGVAVIVGTSAALAAPIVGVGSTFTLSLSQPGQWAQAFEVRFDGVSEVFTLDHGSPGLAPVQMSVDERLFDLGNGSTEIFLALRFSGGDPFPFLGNGALGLGESGTPGGPRDALDLSESVELTAADLFWRNPQGTRGSRFLIPVYSSQIQTSPWDGRLVGGGQVATAAFGGFGIDQIDLFMDVRQLQTVNEPTTLTLALLAVAATAALRRGAGVRPARRRTLRCGVAVPLRTGV